jgi:acetyl esterase/lipase
MKTVFHSLVLFFLTLCLGCQDQDVTSELDVSYGKAGGQDLLLDVFSPLAPSKSPLPAVIFIHGGGWYEGSKENFKDAAQALAKQGYITFSLNYRLAKNGHNHWPAQLDDVQRAVRWVRAHAAQYHLDPQHIGAIGHSAGGHLVTCLGTRDTRDNSDPALAKYSSRVTCVVDMSGPVDLVKRESTQGDGIIRNFLGGTPEELPALARDASPLGFVDAQTVPFLLIHGRLDTLVPPQQAERLDAALRQTGIESKLLIFPDENHGISKPANGDQMVRETLAFLQQHLQPAPAK